MPCRRPLRPHRVRWRQPPDSGAAVRGPDWRLAGRRGNRRAKRRPPGPRRAGRRPRGGSGPDRRSTAPGGARRGESASVRPDPLGLRAPRRHSGAAERSASPRRSAPSGGMAGERRRLQPTASSALPLRAGPAQAAGDSRVGETGRPGPLGGGSGGGGCRCATRPRTGRPSTAVSPFRGASSCGRLPWWCGSTAGPWNHVRSEFSAVTQVSGESGLRGVRTQLPGIDRLRIPLPLGAAGGTLATDGSTRTSWTACGTSWLGASAIRSAWGSSVTPSVASRHWGLSPTPPILFRVGVASAPPIDLVRAAQDLIERDVSGDAIHGRLAIRESSWWTSVSRRAVSRLKRQSPERRLAETRRPLLIMAGGRDPKVDLVDVTHYAGALHGLGRDVSLWVDQEMGHSFDRPSRQQSYLYLLERFLGAHLGGRVGPPPQGHLASEVSSKLRVVGTSLRRALEHGP